MLITRMFSPEPVAQLPYGDLLAMRVDGPGAVTQGGGFVGGGFGLAGAAEGMIVASVLNALSTRTTIQTIVEIQDRTLDLIFFHSRATPQQLRLTLLPVEAKLRQFADEKETRQRQGDVAVDPLDRLEKLTRLHRDGALTDEEFSAAKRTLLGAL